MRKISNSIFATLSFEDIKRLRCVSQYWKRLIEDEERVKFVFPINESNVHETIPVLTQLTVPPHLTSVIFTDLSNYPSDIKKVKMESVIITGENSDEVFWSILSGLNETETCRHLDIRIKSVPILSEFAFEVANLNFINSLQLTISSERSHIKETYHRDQQADERDVNQIEAFMQLLDKLIMAKLEHLSITVDFDQCWTPVNLAGVYNFIDRHVSSLKYLKLALRVKSADEVPNPKKWTIQELNLQLKDGYMKQIEPLITSVDNFEKLKISGWPSNSVGELSGIIRRLLPFMETNCAKLRNLSIENFLSTSEEINLLRLPVLVELSIDSFYLNPDASELVMNSFPMLKSLKLNFRANIYNLNERHTMCSKALEAFKSFAPNLKRVVIIFDMGISMVDFISCMRQTENVTQFFFGHSRDEKWMDIHLYYVRRSPGLLGHYKFENGVRGLNVFVDRIVYK